MSHYVFWDGSIVDLQEVVGAARQDSQSSWGRCGSVWLPANLSVVLRGGGILKIELPSTRTEDCPGHDIPRPWYLCFLWDEYVPTTFKDNPLYATAVADIEAFIEKLESGD